MFTYLNQLQYILQRPYRPMLKHNTKTLRILHQIRVLHWTYNIVMYIVLAPLRLVNAIWYDILVYGIFSIKDHIDDIIKPKLKLWTHKTGFIYFLYWFFGLPVRILKNSFISIIKIFEGILFTAIDVIVPTITMMHGTKRGASVNISIPGSWRVGDGNYAGTGIYFTMDKNTAEHYASSSSAGDDRVIVYARVSLGRNLNLSVVPKDVHRLVNNDGDKLTKWGLDHHVTSFEWWRSSGEWWEYCMLALPRGSVIKTWRIRILYIYNLSDKKVQRIWGGKSFWLG